MGAPTDDPNNGWLQNQVQQRALYLPAIRQAHEMPQPKGTKFILDLIEFVGPGTVLTLIGLGALVMAKKALGKWFPEGGK